jgi:hypothetical protein
LFNVEEEGNKKREDFFLNCIKDANNFEQAISTLKCHTFTDMTNKKKNYCCPRRDGTTNAARPIRTTIQISLKKELDLDKVLTYPLTPVPLSLCPLDGTICKRPKSALMTLLEKYEQSEPPQDGDVVIYDG